MSGSKKPRKKYHPGKVLAGGHLPPPAKNVQQVETKALMALESIRSGFYDRDIAIDLISMLTVCRKVIGNGDTEALRLLHRAFSALNSIKDRHSRTGKWGASGDEIRALSESVPPMIDLYKQMNRDEIASGVASLNYRLNRLGIDKPC